MQSRGVNLGSNAVLQRYQIIIFFVLAMVCGANVLAQSYIAPPDYRFGAVMARAIILDKKGQPILVQYNKDGTEAGLANIEGSYKDKIKTLRVIPVAEYRMEKERLRVFKEQHSENLSVGAEVKSKKDFLSEQYTLADGKTTIAPPSLPDYVKSVFVRAQINRILNDPEQLVLLKFSVDLSEEKELPETGSVVLSEEGTVVGSSDKTIGPRVAFFGDPDKADNSAANYRKQEDKIFGPVPNVKVQIPIFRRAVDVTDKDGKYSLKYNLPSCPGFSYLYEISVMAELKYANFSPLGEPVQTYPISQPTYMACNGSHALLAFSGNLVGMGVYQSLEVSALLSSTEFKQVDLFADVMFLAGKVVIKNPDGSAVSIGDKTEYAVSAPESKKVNQANYDFDGDGKPDTTTLGNVTEQPQDDGSIKKVFTANPNGEWQAVYFSSNTQPSGEPDAIRLADSSKKLESNGLLSSISKEDLKNTDILVFRESTGELYMERKGLPDEEIKWEGAADEDEGGQIGLGKGGQYFHYRLALRGIMDMDINFSGDKPTGTWNDWATDYHLEEPFQKHESYHLHPGEWVRVVAINRATGYMGTKRVLLNSAADNESGFMSLPVDQINLMPPNLKIWATRDYTQESGLQQGKQTHFNLIGMEGAALVSDDKISVFTEWLDEDGRPLPEGLGSTDGKKYGLTGRLARVIGQNQLGEVRDAGSDTTGFPIAPGLNRQIMDIHTNLTQAEHLYIHVSGTAQNENPQFASDNPTEALSGRPKHVTPFMVPINDEDADWQTWSVWNQLKRAFDAGKLDEEPIKPKGIYAWHYRPEYQFSQLSLEVEKIQREYTDASGESQTQELLVEQKEAGRIPTIRGDDDLVTVFFSLVANNINRLSPLEGEQELVFGFGATEIKATLGANGQVSFDNLAHINYLDPVDLLTLRLYVNHDAANTLWEWAFTRNGLHVYYEVPGNTQEKSKRSLPTVSDVNCGASTCSDIEILALLAKEEAPTITPPAAAPVQPDPKVRTLGGMRLRFRYIPPSLDGLAVTKVAWKMGYKGRYCNRYGVDSVACVVKAANDIYELKQSAVPMLPSETGDWSVYWEPVNSEDKTDWSNWAGSQTTDHGLDSQLKAEYTVPAFTSGIGGVVNPVKVTKFFEQKFTLNTRELRPATGTETVMKGSDVAMLEAILWDLGMSPSAKPGIGGVRLATDPLRSEYLSSTPSVGRMVGRFNYISFGPIDNPTQKMDMVKQDNNEPIAELGLHWQHYMQAYSYWKNATVLYSDLDATTVNQAESVWDGIVNYPNGISFPNIDVTYSAARHNNVQTLTGGSFSRSDILKSMAQIEVSGRHQRDYRITVGGADERGSKGFNQLLNTYNYGASAEDGNKKAAIEVTAYRADGSSAVNHYDARFNIIAKAAWMAVNDVRSIADGGSGGGSFYRAFVATGSRGYQGTYTWSSSTPLKRIKVGDVSNAVSGTSHLDDDYERLAKGLGGYNQGAGIFSGGNDKAWINMLFNRSSPKSQDFIDAKAKSYSDRSGDEKKLFANTEAMRYAMSIMHDSDKLKLNYRVYVWKGGVGVDVNGDGVVKNIAANPSVNPPQPEVIEESVEWCFAYGEQDWLSPAKNPLTNDVLDWDGYKDLASADASKRVRCI